MLRFAMLVTLSLCALACGSGQPDDDSRAEAESGVFDPMVDTLDRAEQVEDLSQDRKRQLDDALEQ